MGEEVEPEEAHKASAKSKPGFALRLKLGSLGPVPISGRLPRLRPRVVREEPPASRVGESRAAAPPLPPARATLLYGVPGNLSLGKNICCLGKDTHRHRLLGLVLRPCGFTVAIPALSLTSASVALGPGHQLCTMGRLPVLCPRVAVRIHSANT